MIEFGEAPAFYTVQTAHHAHLFSCQPILPGALLFCLNPVAITRGFDGGNPFQVDIVSFRLFLELGEQRRILTAQMTNLLL